MHDSQAIVRLTVGLQSKASDTVTILINAKRIRNCVLFIEKCIHLSSFISSPVSFTAMAFAQRSV